MNNTNRIEGAKIPHTGHRLAVTLWKKRKMERSNLIKNEYTPLLCGSLYCCKVCGIVGKLWCCNNPQKVYNGH